MEELNRRQIYYQKNIEKYKEYYRKTAENRLELITCECGTIIKKYCLKLHLISNKHKTIMNVLNQYKNQQQAQHVNPI